MVKALEGNGNRRLMDINEVFQTVTDVTKEIQIAKQRLEAAEKNMESEQKTLESLISQREGLLLDLVQARVNATEQELVQLQEGIRNQEKQKGKETNK